MQQSNCEFQISNGLRERESINSTSTSSTTTRAIKHEAAARSPLLPSMQKNLGRHSQHKMKTTLNADNDDSMLFLDIFVIFCTEPTFPPPPPTWKWPHRVNYLMLMQLPPHKISTEGIFQANIHSLMQEQTQLPTWERRPIDRWAGIQVFYPWINWNWGGPET